MKLALFGALCVQCLSGQAFDVVSIRLSAPPTSRRIQVDFEGGPGTSDPTRFVCRNCGLWLLVMHAYDVEYNQVAGLDSHPELYDIAAKVPERATEDQFRVMLQKLLSNRFNMGLHRETKRMQAYELVVGQNGPHMKASVAVENIQEAVVSNSSGKALDSEGFPVLPRGQSGYDSVNGRARLQLVGATIGQLAGKLSNQLDVPVTDATGLTGKYDFSIHWAGQSTDATDDAGPSLFSAVESQLGLRLNPTKAAVTIIVVDRVDRIPTEN